MKKLLFIFNLLLFAFCNAQASKFVGNWVNPTELIVEVGEVDHFSISIKEQANQLCIMYCYICPKKIHEDCPDEYCAAETPANKINNDAIEIEIKTFKGNKGKVILTQKGEYLYWKLIVRPPDTEYLPEEYVFVKRP